MAKNKIITSQGNVQFINSKGKTISMHPMHCYAVYQDDTVSFLFIYMKEYSGQAFFSSQFEDLEVDGVTYDSIDALKEAIAEAFAKAGAQARTEIVDELPETGYTNTIYLIKKEHGEGYDEYVYNEEKGWQLIGDTDIEFERYLQKVDFNAYSADTKEKIDFISGAVDDNASDIQFISGAVDTEIASREAADTVISGAVDTLSTNLANEVSRAQNAEQTLQNNINTVNSRVDAEQIARANADNALSGAIDSVDDKIEALSGEVQTMGDEAIVDAAYVSSSTTIDFYNASGDVVAQVDARDFIKDGMIEDVRIENGYLIIDFNTASGKQDISIPLTDIFNPDNYYDKTAVDGLLANKANSADVYNKSEVYTKAEVDEAIAEIDLSDYYNKTEVDGKLADKADLSALTEDERVWGEALNDLNSRINTVSGDVADKASQSALDLLNGVVTAHTANTTVHVTSAEKAIWNAKSDFSGDYNDLTNKLSAGTNITIVDNVISATGGGGGGTVESAITSGSTNAVESKAIWSATTYNKGVLLTFNGNRESTNYPEGCGKLVVGNIGFGSCFIDFLGNDMVEPCIIHINNYNWQGISVDVNFDGATYEIDGNNVTIIYPSTDITYVQVGRETGWTYTAVVEGAWVSENTYMKEEVDAIASGLQNNINSKLDATAYTPTVVDSALNVASQNPVQNQALYSELRINNGETETTLEFENSESTNYPNGCTKLIVEVVGSDNHTNIDFLGDQPFGNIRIDNWGGSINVNSSFDSASYEISGTTVIITYPTVTSVTKISTNGNGSYVYKAITSLTTPLKDQVTANTTALGGLSLVKLTQAEYDALTTKDNNTLYIISD